MLIEHRVDVLVEDPEDVLVAQGSSHAIDHAASKIGGEEEGGDRPSSPAQERLRLHDEPPSCTPTHEEPRR
jgi:hypothetical protein